MKRNLINTDLEKIEMGLVRDVSKHIRRGHRWIFDDCFDQEKKIKDGIGILKNKNEILAFGIVQKDTKLKFRVLVNGDEFYFKANNIDSTLLKWANYQFEKAVLVRSQFRDEKNNSFRLINGEGDGMPGLIVDIYDSVAVIKHDHPIMEEFWNHNELKEAILESFNFIKCVYLKRRNDDENKGEEIYGKLPPESIFMENGMLFQSNIRDAAKTGFFLDQRDNRKLLSLFTKNKSVLNLFSYTGGFSVFSAIGGALSVTSVDIAKNAIKACETNFAINNLKTKHEAICEDAFLFIEKSIKEKKKWDVVITDPPSFAPNQKALDNAIVAYEKVFLDSLRLVNNNGIFVASSCSSHITEDKFLEILENVFSKNRKRGTLVYLGGQPFDHPYPLAMPELRYLKFALFRID